MESEVKGFTKDNTKKLLAWEGWKKELGWIMLFLFLGIVVWAYWTETKTCREMTNSEEFQEFLFNKAIEKIREENPTVQITDCDYKKGSCKFSGISEDILNQWGLFNNSYG